MDYEFLRRLYMSCTEGEGNGFMDGLNLSELYEHIEATKQADVDFSEMIASEDREMTNKLEIASYSACEAYELQGFINGFRICWMLQKEMLPYGGRKEKQ